MAVSGYTRRLFTLTSAHSAGGRGSSMRIIVMICAWMALATVVFAANTINPKTGPFITVRVADRYGAISEIDSVNILAIDGNTIRITRKGNFIGAWGIGQVEVVR